MSQEKKIVPIVPFLERIFILPNGKLVQLMPHQKAILEHALTPNKNGILPYRQFVWSCGKKSGKTSIGAMIAAWFAFSGICGRNGEIYYLANDLEQSQSRGYRDLKRCIESNPVLLEACSDVHIKHIILKDGTMVQAISSDYAGAAGSNPNLSLFDELWGFTSEGARRLFDEMTPPPTRENAMRVITTYAGFVGESELLEDIYKRIVRPENLIDLGKYKNTETGELTQLPVYASGDSICLHPRSSVQFADGTRMRISKVVNEKIDKKVICMIDGKFEERPIVGWYRTKLGNRYYMRVGYENGRYRRTGTWVTNDHEIFTPNGKVRADNLRNGDLILTKKDAPNEKQMALIVGTLLGDAHLTSESAYRTELRMIHHKGQIEWIFLKTIALDRIGQNGSRWIRSMDGAINFESRSSQALLNLREMFYSNKKKIVPYDLVSRYMSPELLAAWYLDDGSRSNHGAAVIYTQSFSRIDCEYLCQKLVEYGIKCHVREYKRYGGSGCIIHISPIGLTYLSQKIGHLVPQSMRYKLADKAPEFDENSWNLGKSTQDAARAIIEHGAPPHDGPARWAYCVDVEEAHNFFSGNVLVRNCYWDHEPRMPWQDAKYYHEQINQPGFRLSAFRRIHRNEWVEAEEGMDMRFWDRCVDFAKENQYFAPISPSRDLSLAVGIDASLVKDRAAVVSAFRRHGKIWQGPYQVWQPTKEDPLNFERTIEKYLLELNKQFFLAIVYYDPWQMESSAQRLRERGLPMVPYPQTQPNTIKMTENFLDKLSEGNIIIIPDDDLRNEAMMVSIKEVPGRGRRFIKDNKNKKIDTLIAFSMAVLGATSCIPDYDEIGGQIIRLARRRT